MEPLMRKKLHYDWHWVWPTGCGDLGNQGIHQMDIARWALGVDHLSPKVFSLGGRVGYIDDGTTPNTLIVYHEYKNAPLIFEVRGLPASPDSREMDKYHGASIGVVVDCEGGRVVIPNYTAATVFDKEGKEIKSFKGSSSHYKNFIDAVHSRKHEELHADILDGHISSALCHTGNISYQLGKQAKPGEVRERIQGDKDAVNTFDRMQHHLESNGVDLSKSPVTLGEFLKMNPRKQKFTNNPKANTLLTREYRKPFVVPDKVST
jgi:predicted dehydrogenase